MFSANGLPTVKAPSNVPSEELFGARMASTTKLAASQDSVRTGASGYQEDDYEDMQVIGERDPRRRPQMPPESIYAQKTRERRLTEDISLSLEDISMREEMRSHRSKEETKTYSQKQKKNKKYPKINT